MINFLLVYDRKQGRVLNLASYAEQEAAMQERFRLERQYAGDRQIEVVVLVAESEPELRRTHARYFTSFGGLVEGLRSGLSAT